ncbi:MAG TPA: PqqD family protein [Eubacteriales bacterium]|nr:PqqD family protein [Clostridia bacterium]HRV72633.1 PqqD family protein [Eubacteriales bacterium]
MKHKKDFLLQKVSTTYVVVAVNEAAISFKRMITFNETGAFLWEALDNDCTEEQLVKALTDEYDVCEAIASRDVGIFVERLRAAGLIDD